MMKNEKAEIARLAEKYGRVQSLMQYVNKKTLAESYRRQPRKKAVGVDGVTKEQYGEQLNEKPGRPDRKDEKVLLVLQRSVNSERDPGKVCVIDII